MSSDAAQPLIASSRPDVLDCLALIFMLLPTDSRLAGREVCRSWASTLDDSEHVARFWEDVDLSAGSGAVRRSEKIMQACLRRRTVRRLSLWPQVDLTVLRDSLAENGALLGTLCLEASPDVGAPSLEALERLLAAAPLRRLSSDVTCHAEAVQRLRAADRAGLAISVLALTCVGDAAAGGPPLPTVVSSLEELSTLNGLKLVAAAPETLRAVALRGTLLPLVARGLRSLEFEGCSLLPSSLRELAAALASGSALETLRISNGGRPLFLNLELTRTFGAALRDCTKLRELALTDMRLWEAECVDFGIFLLASLTAHPTLRILSLARNSVRDGHPEKVIELGCELGELLSSRGCALEELDLRGSDVSLRHLFDWLPHSARLHTLLCSGGARVTEAVARAHILPRVRAAAPLRRLSFGAAGPPALAEAVEEVHARFH